MSWPPRLFACQSGIESDDRIDPHSGAAALVTGNTIVTVSGSGPLITRMASGVELSSAAASTVVSGNTITGPIVGISTTWTSNQSNDASAGLCTNADAPV